jgi:pimeloyl-ACP methyl ester carboxylesterase
VRALATTETGTGPAVLMVHGLNGFKEGWGPLPGALAAAGMRVVAVDLPGFGASPRAAGRTSPGSLAGVLAPLVDRLAPVALVAHSLGTQVAMLLARDRPGAVRALALLGPAVIPRPMRFPPRGVADVLQLPVVGRLAARAAIGRIRRDPARRRDAYLGAVADPAAMAADPEMAALLREASDRLLHADLRAMADWAASALAFDARPLAAHVPQPALVVWGDRDRVTQPVGSSWLSRALPAGRGLELPGVGHFPHLEARDAVVPAVVAAVA